MTELKFRSFKKSEPDSNEELILVDEYGDFYSGFYSAKDELLTVIRPSYGDLELDISDTGEWAWCYRKKIKISIDR